MAHEFRLLVSRRHLEEDLHHATDLVVQECGPVHRGDPHPHCAGAKRIFLEKTRFFESKLNQGEIVAGQRKFSP